MTGVQTCALPIWLGLGTEELQGHLFVTNVTRDGPAEKAGIRRGDILVGVGRDSVRSHEEFYRRIMICHHRLGRPSEALAAYQRCRRTLRAALGVAPSPETEAVLKSVKEGRERPLEPVGSTVRWYLPLM